MSLETIDELLSYQRRTRPDATALMAPGREALSYRALETATGQVASSILELGVRRGERVAVVMPNGPEMAVAFLAAARVATSVPLNPTARRTELELQFRAARVDALLSPSGVETPARMVATNLGVRVLDVEVVPEAPAGALRVVGDGSVVSETRHSPSRPDDIALVLPTSGTTSSPKIVPLTHRNICLSAANIGQVLELSATDRCLNVMPLFHIHGLVGAVLSSLASGASVVCTSGFDADHFFDWLDQCRPTWYTAVPTMHQAVLGRASEHPASVSGSRLRVIRSSSAALSPNVMRDLETLFGVPVIESYGMTEASHQVASNPLPPGERAPGCVGLAAGPDVAIMDARAQWLEANQTGEVVIRGETVTSGYENDADTNAIAFVHGWLRTGDEGYLDEAGRLHITGRLKEIINRGGEKISPHEVDEVLLEHPSIAQSATFAVPHVTLGEDVATAVVLRPGHDASPDHLRAHAATRLTEFKVPSQVLVVDDLPKGPTGKVQRLGLHEQLQHVLRTDHVAPTDALEEKLLEIWCEVLGQTQLGTQDNFFLSGGDSLLASRVLGRVRAALDVELPHTAVFATPTIRGLAAVVERARFATASAPSPLRRRDRGDVTRLSFSQEQIWFLDRWEPGNPAFNRPVLLQLTGQLNGPALENALNDIVRRHEALRTTFPLVDERPVQRVQPFEPLPWTTVDVDDVAPEHREDEATRLAVAEARRPFDLASGPLVRATLFRLGPTRHRLQIVVHHIAFDGWSANVLVDELAHGYATHDSGVGAPLPPLPIDYADVAQWQRERLRGDTLVREEDFWRATLSGAPPSLELPSDRPRPPAQTSRGAKQRLTLSAADVESLRSLARRAQATVFMVMLTAFKVLLARYSGQDDVVVGTPVAGRSPVEAENLIGLFIKTVPLRTDLSGGPTFLEAVNRVRDVALEAYAHQELPFTRIVDVVQSTRDASRHPIFQVMFNLENVPRRSRDFPGLEVEPVDLDCGVAHLDLTLEVTEDAGETRCTFVYNADLFDTSTIERMIGHFHELLRGLSRDPLCPIGQLPLLTEGERHQLVTAWNETSTAYPSDRCIHELFQEQAAKSPGEVAVTHDGRDVTYLELNRRSNQLARHLRDIGVGPNVLVGLCVERSAEMIIGILGVLKAGGAYVPLDPAYPQERVAFMLEDAGATVLLTQDRLLERLSASQARAIRLDADWDTIAPQADEDLRATSSPTDPAYVIYTSGSTGTPKGVLCPHRNAVNRVHWTWVRYPLGPDEICCQKTAVSFVDAVREIFVPLLRGGRLVIIPDAVVNDPHLLIDTLAAHRVTRIELVPSLLEAILDTEDDLERKLADLTLWSASGEALSVTLCERFHRRLPRAELLNLYGATEASATHYRTQPRETSPSTVPIGRPISNTQVLLLDRALQPVPIGVAGELHFGGDGVALGYLDRPTLTAERFIRNPFSDLPGQRLYRTGDLARYRPDGVIEYLGRIDNQVKIRGFRVELGETEEVLRRSGAVREAVVVARVDEHGRQALAAYVVPMSTTTTAGTLREHLKQHLPDFMVPTTIDFLDALPRTPNGKTDRGALPEPDRSRPTMEPSFSAPRTPAEASMVEIWKEVLDREGVGVNDDFFELGGHSLHATMLANRIRTTFDVNIPIASIFRAPTVAGLVELIEPGDEKPASS